MSHELDAGAAGGADCVTNSKKPLQSIERARTISAMRQTVRILFIAMTLLVPALASAGPGDDVRQAETQFADAFARRDRAAFASFIAPDATFIVNGKPVSGRDAILKSWAKFLETPTPPFSWKSEQVHLDEPGSAAMSLGGVFDAEGKRVATFTSFWQKRGNEWKVVFDAPPSPAPKPQ